MREEQGTPGDGPTEVDRYAKWEWSPPAFRLPYANPFDPGEIRLDVTFHGPSGSPQTVPGFHDGERFLVRFSPGLAGPWHYHAVARAGGGRGEQRWHGGFTVREAGRRGFLRLSGGGFRHETGEPFTAVGENLCWGDPASYHRWLRRLGQVGANYARLWMAPWGFALEWTETPPGDYTRRMPQATELDAVFDLAEQNGVALQLCMLNHGQFSTRVNPDWAGNPWNAARPGGFLQRPQDVFTDPRAQDLFLRRLRYVVARWGYATHLLAWELWNEVDLTDAYASGHVAAWHAQMASALRAMDPYRHPITTSFAKPQGDPAVWRLPEIDVTQVHRYGFSDVPGDIAADVHGHRTLGKPVLYGEFGLDAGGPDTQRDPAGVHLHQGLWAGLLSGSVGTAMTWWWDNYVDPQDLYPLWMGPSAFSRGVFADTTPAQMQPLSVNASDAEVGVLALVADQRAAAWIWDRRVSWRSPSAEPVSGVRLDLGNLPPGGWSVTWWDTRTGSPSDGGTVQGGSGGLLAVPEFRGDLALALRR